MIIKLGKNDKIELVRNAGVEEDLKVFIDKISISGQELEDLDSGLIIVTDRGLKTLYDYRGYFGGIINTRTLGVYEPHQESYLYKKVLIEFYNNLKNK